VTAHDRTPAPPLDEAELQAIEQRQERAADGVFLLPEERDVIRTDVPALVAALRAAWRENARLRAAVTEVLPRLRGGSDEDVFCYLCDDFYQGPDGPVPHAPECPVLVLRAALAAPGEGERAC
jgi:hypothetical protein